MNPFTGKEYSDSAKKERLKLSLMPAADPLVLTKLTELFKNNKVVLVKAETGAGKGVVIAPHILELVYDTDINVTVTQPRTVNTHVAEYLKIVLDNPEIVNYGYRFANNITKRTRLAFVTDGFLLNLLYSGNDSTELSDKRVVIIDEAHERNKNIDQLMLLCKTLNTKLILMSATIDLDFYKKYFNTTAVLEVSGRTFPVTHVYSNAEEDYVKQAVTKVAEILDENKDAQKDILIFLNSSNELKKACKLLEKLPVNCYELHKGTSQEIKETIIKANATDRVKVVFSTNVAESGITIDGVGFVIDCGRRYESIFNSKEEMYELILTFISKSEVQQRAGRAGRTAPGTCYHLYSEKDYENMIDYKLPEIQKEEISDMLLQIAKVKSADIIKFSKIKDFTDKLPTPPTQNQLNFGLKILQLSGLINVDETLTKLGIEVSKIPLEPQQAVCLLKSKFLRVDNSICKILAMVSLEPNIEEWFFNRRPNDSDYSDYIKKINGWKNVSGDIFALAKMLDKFLEYGAKGLQWCQKNYIHYSKMANAKKQFYKLLNLAKTLNNTHFWHDEDELKQSEKNKIILCFIEGYKINIAERIGKGSVYNIQRPCGMITVQKTNFITKLKKKIIFLDIKRINNQAKVSSIINVSFK